MSQSLKKLPNAQPIKEAKEQADAYDSLFAERELELEDGSVLKVPPHPDFGMLGDEELEAYEDLQVEIETYDREPDIFIPEQKLENGLVLPAETKKGDLLRPYRKNGERVKPAHSIRVVQAALGEQKYKQLREGGRNAADVWRIWGKQGLEMRARQAADPKSNGSTMDLASVSPTDSQ